MNFLTTSHILKDENAKKKMVFFSKNFRFVLNIFRGNDLAFSKNVFSQENAQYIVVLPSIFTFSFRLTYSKILANDPITPVFRLPRSPLSIVSELNKSKKMLTEKWISRNFSEQYQFALHTFSIK